MPGTSASTCTGSHPSPPKERSRAWVPISVASVALVLPVCNLVTWKPTLNEIATGSLSDDIDPFTNMKEHKVPAWSSPHTELADYHFLRERVMDEHNWTSKRAEGAIVEYLRFLQMIAQGDKMDMIASSDVDLVWHEHLMDTKNYAADCKKLFGRFLHHRRARTSDEFAEIPASYARTKMRYSQMFGQEPPSRFWGATTDAASMCGGGNNVNPSNNAPVTNTNPQTTAQNSQQKAPASGATGVLRELYKSGVLFIVSFVSFF